MTVVFKEYTNCGFSVGVGVCVVMCVEDGSGFVTVLRVNVICVALRFNCWLLCFVLLSFLLNPFSTETHFLYLFCLVFVEFIQL